jgi:hypothetical protein
MPVEHGKKRLQAFSGMRAGHDGSLLGRPDVEALERIANERSRTNRSLEMICRKQIGKHISQFLPTESKKANQRLA